MSRTSAPWLSTPSVKAATSLSGRAHVAGHKHLGGGGVAGERDTEGAGDLGVELVGNRSSDVVRLDDLVESGHGGRQVIDEPDRSSSSGGGGGSAGASGSAVGGGGGGRFATGGGRKLPGCPVGRADVARPATGARRRERRRRAVTRRDELREVPVAEAGEQRQGDAQDGQPVEEQVGRRALELQPDVRVGGHDDHLVGTDAVRALAPWAVQLGK